MFAAHACTIQFCRFQIFLTEDLQYASRCGSCERIFKSIKRSSRWELLLMNTLYLMHISLMARFVHLILLKHRVLSSAKVPIRKRADHAIYSCDYIVCLVGTRPPHLVHDGWLYSCVARSRTCSRGDSVASGPPCHRINIRVN